MNKGKILVTPRSLSLNGHPAFESLKKLGYEMVFCQPGKSPTEEELLVVIPECVGWIAGVEPVSEKVIGSAKQLKVISRNGTGVDNLPLASIEKAGIEVCRAEGANARGVAELVNCHDAVWAASYTRNSRRAKIWSVDSCFIPRNSREVSGRYWYGRNR